MGASERMATHDGNGDGDGPRVEVDAEVLREFTEKLIKRGQDSVARHLAEPSAYYFSDEQIVKPRLLISKSRIHINKGRAERVHREVGA